MKTSKGNILDQAKFRTVLIIILSWMAMGVVITVYDHLLLHTHISNGPSSAYVFLESLGRNVGAGLIGAVIGGSILVLS